MGAQGAYPPKTAGFPRGQDRAKGGSDPSRGLDAESWREFSRDSIVTHGESMIACTSAVLARQSTDGKG